MRCYSGGKGHSKMGMERYVEKDIYATKQPYQSSTELAIIEDRTGNSVVWVLMHKNDIPPKFCLCACFVLVKS